MNNFVVARNALIASAFVMLFMISLNPSNISRAILGVSDAVSANFATKDINAAEKETEIKSTTLQLSSTSIVLPEMDGLTYEENKDAAVLFINEESSFVVTSEKYEGDVKDKAMSLAEKLKTEGKFSKVTVQPVLRGSNMFIEVSSTEPTPVIHYALIKTKNNVLLTIVPSTEVDSNAINTLLSGIRFN